MRKQTIFVAAILLMFAINAAWAGDLFNESAKTNSFLSPPKTSQITLSYFSPLQSTMQDSVPLTREQQLSKLPGYKLPKKALFFSAVIPGAGEAFVGSYWKAAAFFVIEAGAWTYYGVNRSKGLKKEDEFEFFADEHWNSEAWLSWYNGLQESEQNIFTHATHMLELLEEGRRTQQYYEMIGKYSEFVTGWDDLDFAGSGINDISDITVDHLYDFRYNRTDNADYYMDMRAESNDLLGRARTGTTIAMINHLLSAIDAAWTAKIHNNRLLKTALRMEKIHFDYRTEPVLSLKFNW